MSSPLPPPGSLQTSFVSLIIFILVPLFMVIVLLSALVLWIATKILKFEKHDFVTAIIVVVSGGIINLVLTLPLSTIIGLVVTPISWLTGFLVFLLLIKHFYQVNWKNAILAWLISIIPFGFIVMAQSVLAMILWQLGFLD